MQFVLDNWVGITAVLTALFVAAKHIVELTPTQRDDAFMDSIEESLREMGVAFVDDLVDADEEADDAVRIFVDGIIEEGGFEFDGIDYVVREDGEDYDEDDEDYDDEDEL